MANQLRVSTQELRQTSDRYARHRAEMNDTCDRISDVARGTAEYWRGSANDAFQDAFARMYEQLRQTDEKMQDAVDELLKTAGIFEENEARITSAMQSLEIGTSPFRA